MSSQPRRRQPRTQRVAAILGAIVGTALSVGAFSTSGGDFFSHVACATSGPPTAFRAYVPTVMVNSPYGGAGWANATVQPGPFSNPPGFGNGYEIGSANGSAVWDGFGAEFNVTTLENLSSAGLGLDTPCLDPYQIAPSFWGDSILDAPLLGKGNTTDASEPTTLGLTISPYGEQLVISNGFTVANHAPVSTCGAGPASHWANSTVVNTLVPITLGGRLTYQKLALPFLESFRYAFPADFGTWQVDNLSAPGGPGGGWAFSYSPCP